VSGSSVTARARTYRKIGELIEEVFPDGTNVKPTDFSPTPASPEKPDFFEPWRGVPVFAADLFAFCAHVITHTGAMGYFKLGVKTSNIASGNGKSSKITIGLDDEAASEIGKAAIKWQAMGTPPDFVQNQWDIILAAWYRRASVTLFRGEKDKGGELKVREWWNAIFHLLIIADEACDGLGHFVFNEHGKAMLSKSPSAAAFFQKGKSKGKLTNKIPDVGSAMYRLQKDNWREDIDGKQHAKMSWPTLGVASNPAVVSVQPKGRVTSVGCSVRNLSRNLAAVGSLGSVRCNWQQLSRPTHGEKAGQLNLLLIPMPYEIRGGYFSRNGADTFDVKQEWIGAQDADRELFALKVGDLIKKAREDFDIHGVIFPEYALDYKTIEKAIPAIFAASGEKAMFMVAGSSGNCEDEPGNIVMSHIWEGVCCRERGSKTNPLMNQYREFSQRKHQRWRLEEGQIGLYGLGSQLDPSKTWWENHDINKRELHFFQIAEDTVFTSLICEDLARNDPCHDIIRAIAPNLVFALLMDGPQLATRWPARFAGSLADDPGCTVLTFTSYGLIERSNCQFPESEKHAVGLLRDSAGVTTEIVLPKGKDAVIVSLQSKRAKDKTMDGRATRYASKWKFVTQQPVSIGLRDGTWKSPLVAPERIEVR
jgi:hypothetical protein